MRTLEKTEFQAIWFTLQTGECIGVVIVNTGYEIKSYIGKGDGSSEMNDTLHILKRGTPFPVNAAKLMMNIK